MLAEPEDRAVDLPAFAQETKEESPFAQPRTRAEHVRLVIEHVAAACGISATNVRVDARAKTGCRLTRNGIDLMANHKLNEDIANRNRFGVRGSITLAEVDTMVACFVATRAQDFLLEDWCRTVSYGSELPKRAQRYLQTCVDDMAAYARMTQRIAFARTHFEAYLSRAAAHAMSSEPAHLQLMRALRLYVFEKNPQVVVVPAIVEELGTADAARPLVESIARIVSDPELPYQERHAQASQLIVEPFSRMLKRDEQSMGYYEILHLYDDEQSYDASEEARLDDDVLQHEEESAARVQAALEVITGDNIDQLIADNNEPETGQPESVNLSLPSMTEEIGTMSFGDEEDGAYEATAQAHRPTIERIADILTAIATPQEQLSVPRYAPRRAHAGSRMHPNALADAAIQLASGQEKAVWQRVRRTIRPQNMQFQGLDIYLLLDASVSMTGANAASAAAMAACLTEGLELAIHRIASDPKRDAMDVRTQLLAFGEGWAPLTPLETTHDSNRKRFAFAQIANPASSQTLVAAALRHLGERASAEPSRDMLCLIVGDGLFADGLQARKCVMNMPENVYVAHINIGEFAGLPLTGNFETIQDPSVLPEKLYSVLEHRLAAS